jgi:5-methylcytosine-specific restriction enzyme subunit McrC
VGRLPEFHYSRLNERFRKSVEMARWLLRHLMPIFAAGKRSFAFLFDINELFEAYVGALVKRIKPSARLQVERNFGNLKLKPDILIENRLIIDTKYKRVKSRDDISAADKYQMFAYGKNFGVDRVVLLYPDFGETKITPLVLGANHQGINLSIYHIKLYEDVKTTIERLKNEIPI